MLDQVVALAAVSLLAVLEQVYFFFQVIYARRKYAVSPPSTAGPPEFERIHRAQMNSSEYFPIFLVLLWTAGIFFSQAASSFCGLLYLYGRVLYFRQYSQSAQGRLAPLYFSSRVLWLLFGFSALGVFSSFCRLYLNLDLLQALVSAP